MIDGFENFASATLDIRKGADAATVTAFHVPRTNANGDKQREQDANDQDEVWHIQPRRPGDDHDVINAAQQDAEGDFAIEWVCVGEHAEAGDAMRAPRGTPRMGGNGAGVKAPE